LNENRTLAALLTIALYSGTNNSNPKAADVKKQYEEFVALLTKKKGVPSVTAL